MGDSMKKVLFVASAVIFFSVLGCNQVSFEQESPLGTPTLVSPTHNSDTADSVLLDWEDVPDVKRYQVQVAKNPSFSDLVSDHMVVGRSEEIIGDLPHFVTLYWRSRAVEVNGSVGNWPTPFAFKPVRKAFFAPYPQQLYPLPDSKGHETTVFIEWEPVPDAISYHLVVTIDEDMRLFEVDLENLKTTSYLLENLVLTYPYWWKIRTLSAAGYSDWSPVWIFEVKFDEN